MKHLLFVLFVSSFAHCEIWNDLNITSEEYYVLSGQSGLLTGFLFGFAVLYLVISR